MNYLYVAWRVVIRRVWRVPWTTHCRFLPHLANCLDIEMWFEKRCINFIDMACHSKNIIVKTIANMGIHGMHSVIGGNMRKLNSKYEMNTSNITDKWRDLCTKNENDIRICAQIKELCAIRDSHVSEFLTRDMCNDMIEFLCVT